MIRNGLFDSRVARDQPTELCKLVARLLPKDATLKVEDSRSPFLILLEAMNGRGDPHLVKAIEERRAVKTIEGESAVLESPSSRNLP